MVTAPTIVKAAKREKASANALSNNASIKSVNLWTSWPLKIF